MTNRLLLALASLMPLALIVSSCGPSITPATVGKNVFEGNGITAYIPPQGNPGSLASWNFYGPGAIVRRNGTTTDYEAKYILGDADVQLFLQNATSPSGSRTTFQPLSNVRTASKDFDASGGWTAAKALEIKAKLGIHESTTETVQFGDTWAEQITLQGIRQAPGRKTVDPDTRLNLRQGKSQMVQKLIYSDGITIHFNKTVNNNAGASLNITTQQEQKLGGSYHVTSDGGVQVKGPVMIGYVALDKEDANSLFPKK